MSALRFGIRTEASNTDPEDTGRHFLLPHAEARKDWQGGWYE